MTNFDDRGDADTAATAVRIDALCSINRGEDKPCTLVELGCDRASILSPAPVQEADEVIFSLPQIGILEASVETVLYGGFIVRFPAKADSKLGIYIETLQHRDGQSLGSRDFERVVPMRRLIPVEVEGEEPILVRITNLSCSGVAFTSGLAFEADSRVKVGAHPASITRTFDGGATARFDSILPEDAFSSLIDLSEGLRAEQSA